MVKISRSLQKVGFFKNFQFSRFPKLGFVSNFSGSSSFSVGIEFNTRKHILQKLLFSRFVGYVFLW